MAARANVAGGAARIPSLVEVMSEIDKIPPEVVTGDATDRIEHCAAIPVLPEAASAKSPVAM